MKSLRFEGSPHSSSGNMRQASWIQASHTDGMLMTSSRSSEPTSGVA